MKTARSAGLLAGALLACPVYAAAAPEVNFDLGGDLPAFVQYAAGLEQPEPRGERAEDIPVWVTFSNEDIKGLGKDFYFKGQDAVLKNAAASVFMAKTSELGLINESMHAKYHKCAGFFTHSTPDSAKSDLQPPPVSASLAYTIDKPEQVQAMLKLADEKGLTETITSLSAFKNRYYTSVTGVDASKWLQARWKELAAGREDISVAPYRHSNWAQESVVLTVQGTSEPQKIIVLGGHMDSIAGGGGNTVAPGADDNASGIAALTEALRVLVASGYRPAKTLKFMAYAAEEVGLRGSQDIAAAFKREGKQVEGVIQFDMTNYNGSAEDIFLITDHTNASQNAFLGSLVKTYTDYRLGETRCGYACSDHASWTKNGFPASFPFEAKFSEDNPNIHSAKDTIAQSGGHSRHALKFAKLAIAYLVELAK